MLRARLLKQLEVDPVARGEHLAEAGHARNGIGGDGEPRDRGVNGAAAVVPPPRALH